MCHKGYVKHVKGDGFSGKSALTACGGGAVSVVSQGEKWCKLRQKRELPAITLLLRFIRQGEKGSEAGQTSWNRPVITFFPLFLKKKKKNCTKQPHNATQVCDFRWHAGVPQAEMACCSTTMLARLVWLITYVFLNNNNGITCRAGWIIDIIDYQRASCG